MSSETKNSNQHGLTLRLRKEVDQRIDASAIQPSMLAKLSLSEIGARVLVGSNRSFRLDDLFQIIGDASEHVIVQGDCSRFDRLGAGMKSGRLTIMGNAGNECGADLAGGSVEVFGDSGDYLAMGMRRGTLTVHGSAGDYAAGPSIGATRGMSGGDCCVLGNVGDRACERMRRGIFYVQGDAGDYGAAQLIAGTFIVLGRIGRHWAQGMKRGSIILADFQPKSFDASLTSAREFELSFLPLLWNHLRVRLADTTARLPQSRWAQRQIGDCANGGMGEVLTLNRHRQ